MSFYEVKVVNRSGTVLATFDANVAGDARQKATVEQVTWALNEPGSATIKVPAFHPAASEIVALKREVQVWRNGSLIFWGVAVQRDMDDATGTLTWTCPGLLWYFTRRFFGPISVQLLSNPRFATDLAGWTAVGCTATHSTTMRLRGPGTAKLVATTSGDNYLQQQLTVASTPAIGLAVTVAGLFHVESMTAPALEERGIYISAPNALSPAQWEPITMNQKSPGLQRAEAVIGLAGNLVNEVVTVRLYAPQGTIRWGGISATLPESVGSGNALPEDAGPVIGRIIDYAQNGAGKSPLNIAWSTPNTGTSEFVTYQFSELANIFTALQGYPERGVCDFDIVLTPTSRTFTTYAPRKGVLRSGNALTVPGSSVLSLGYLLDGQQTATQVVRRGEGAGSDRELGVASDTTGTEGLVLQDVGDAPPEISIDGLDAYAATDLARLKSIVTLPDMTVPAEGWIGVVSPGDTVPVTVDWGAVQDTSTRRVVSLTLNPLADTVAVGFNVT